MKVGANIHFEEEEKNISIGNDLFCHQNNHSFTLFQTSYYHYWHGLLLSPFWIFSLCLNVPFGLTIKRTEGRYIQYMAEWRGITLNYITLLYITHTYKRRAPIKPTINETFQSIFHPFCDTRNPSGLRLLETLCPWPFLSTKWFWPASMGGWPIPLHCTVYGWFLLCRCLWTITEYP